MRSLASRQRRSANRDYGGGAAAARKALGSLAQAARAAHLKLEVVRNLEQVLASDTHARRGVRHGVRRPHDLF